MFVRKKGLLQNARMLRRTMTPEEMHLWLDFLKGLPVTVKRQRCIESYIVDFYIAAWKLVIELDGVQHGEPEHVKADRERDAQLSALGLKVLRYRNEDVRDRFSAVCEDILKHAKK